MNVLKNKVANCSGVLSTPLAAFTGVFDTGKKPSDPAPNGNLVTDSGDYLVTDNGDRLVFL